MDDWWDEFDAASNPDKLRMVWGKLQTLKVEHEEYADFVSELATALEETLPQADYVRFLEELRDNHPEKFAADTGWYVWTLVMFYIWEQRWDDVDRTVIQFANRVTSIDEAVIPVMQLIRLTGRELAAQTWVEGIWRVYDPSQWMPGANHQWRGWMMFPRFQACVAAGASKEAIDAVYEYAIEIRYIRSPQSRHRLAEFLRRLAGKGEPWSPEKLQKGNRKPHEILYLLTADFTYWLVASRGMKLIVADELRHMLANLLEDMECDTAGLLKGVQRQELEPPLSRCFHIFSLRWLDAPAGLIALWQFYDFLSEQGLVEPSVHKDAQSLFRTLWTELCPLVDKCWPGYTFLAGYLPPSARN